MTLRSVKLCSILLSDSCKFITTNVLRGAALLLEAFTREEMKVASEMDAVGVATKDKAWQSHLLVFTLVAFGN